VLTNIFEPTHQLIIMVIALLILGPKRLPAAGRSLGQGLKEFRSSITGEAKSDEITPPAVPAKEDDGPEQLAA
jgi:sec-independent protein translocase protein TatA